MALFSRQELVRFVEGVYLEKYTGQPITRDEGGYRVDLTDSLDMPGRYHLVITGPTGISMTKRNFVREALGTAAEILYHLLANRQARLMPRPQADDDEVELDEYAQADLEFEHRDIVLERERRDAWLDGDVDAVDYDED